jgi:PAS domain S-box-containing protein
MIWDVRRARARILEPLAVMAVYYAAGRIGLAVPFTHSNMAPVWPAAGVAVGAALMFGGRAYLGIAAGSFLISFFQPVPHLAALGIAFGNTLGPAITAVLLRRKSIISIQRLSDVLNLILFSCVGTLISAVIGSSTLSLTGSDQGRSLLTAITVWWFSDLLGVFLIIPLFLTYSDFKLTRSRLAELALLTACLLAGSELLFRQTSINGAVFGFFLLPFVVWGAVRFSIAGAAFSSLVVSAFALWETSRGDVRFLAYGSWLQHMQGMQVFVGVISLSGLCLAAAIAERTKVKEALAREEILRRGEEKYRRIVETTNEGVWLLDADFNTTFVNQRMAEILGFTPEEMLGRHLYDFYFLEDVPQKQADIERRRKGIREVFYNRCRKRDGSEIWVLVSTCPVLSSKGEFTGVMAMLSDVTLLRKSEETLRRNEKLITAGRLAAAISHEVNNPLEAVVNLLYLLKSESMSEQAQSYVELASREIHRVSAISKRSLGFFRDAAAWTEILLPELLDDTLSFYEHEFAARGIEVAREYRSRGVMRGSRGEIQQVFANLISNAFDAIGGEGALTVRVYDVFDGQNPVIAVEVQDTGSGIGDDDLNRIFEPFFTTKQDTGTGLGLWVAKEIIQKHGGTIAVHSQCGNGRPSGTRFSIFLPAPAAATANAVA